MCPDLSSSTGYYPDGCPTPAIYESLETLDIQKDPKAMLVKDWVIAQSKDPAIREIK